MVTGDRSAPRAPRIFLDAPDSVEADVVTLRGSTAHRLTRVLRLRRGDPVEVIDESGGRLLFTTLLRVGAESVEAVVERWQPLGEEPPPTVVLYASLIRATRFDWMVEKVTELGVHTIVPVRATRSMASGEGHERFARWRRLVTEASEQCRRPRRPIVERPADLGELLAAAAPANSLRIFASEAEQRRRVQELVRPDCRPDRVEILVGPEGGFTEAEAEAARRHGWEPVTLGPRPLRSETAAIVAVAVVQEALHAAS